MPKNSLVQSYGALKLASFPGQSVTKILNSATMKIFDTVEKSIKKLTKNAEKPMSKNAPVQSYETFTLVLFPVSSVIEISKSANMKN